MNELFVSDIQETFAGQQNRLRPYVSAIPRWEVELPPIVRAANLIGDQDITQPPELIKELLHKGLKGVVSAPSKAGKTWLLLDLAISVASGVKWLKWHTEKSKVLFVNFEIPPYFMKSRIQLILSGKGFGLDMGNLEIWNLRGFSAPLEDLIPRMIEQVESNDYGLIILDPIYKGMAGTDENRAGDVSKMVNEIERLCVTTKAAVVYAHHFSKGNKAQTDLIDRMSGSGVFGRDPDMILGLTEHMEPNCYSVEAVTRNLKAPAGFVIERTFPIVTVRSDLDFANLKAKGGKPPGEDKSAAILGLIKDKPTKASSWQKEANEELGISKSTFYDYLEEFSDEGWTEKDGRNGPYKLTAAGVEFLNKQNLELKLPTALS